MFDKATFNDFRKRSMQPSQETPRYTKYDTDDKYHAAIGWHTSLGYNAIYVGGAYTHGAYRGQRNGTPSWGGQLPYPVWGNPYVSGGQFYITNLSDARFPDTLIMFGSARGADVMDASSSFWSWGAAKPDPVGPQHIVRPGYWLIAPPAPHPINRGGYQAATTLGWGWRDPTNNQDPGNKYDPRKAPSTWGMLRADCGDNSAATARLDGSVKVQTLLELRDMRKWCNYADREDWTFVPYR